MLQHSEFLFKVICGLAGAVLLYQAAHVVVRGNPLAKVRIPQLPTLTNAPIDSTTASAAGPVTGKAGTNVNALAPSSTNTPRSSTNMVSASNTIPSTASGTAALAHATAGSGKVPLAKREKATDESNLMASGKVLIQTNTAGRTNPLASAITKSTASVTNMAAGLTNANTTNMSVAAVRPGGMVMGMPGMGPGGPRGPVTPLPKDIQARVDRVTDSEFLAPVMRPLPMALLGIAGNDVFLRAANGQTGLVKEGDSLGGIKLLKIGINRVLVEEDGQKKELTIFSGMGGESLMPTLQTNL